jgi:L-rhamnose 1-dehydrogenase
VAADLLAGKVALITGAGSYSGIGRGIALVLAEHGADIAINDNAHTEAIPERLAELEALGHRALFVKADVSDSLQVDAMIAEVVRKYGHLDIYVSNAGVQVWQDFVEVTPDAWREITGVNLHGCFYGCQAAAARMRDQGHGGSIVVISSVHVEMPFASMGVYGATKQGIGLLVGVMAREWARDRITVNHIGPGWVDSEINRASPSLRNAEDRRATMRSIPLEHRPASPREIGEAVAFLVGEHARYITGAFLRIDGGLCVGKY